MRAEKEYAIAQSVFMSENVEFYKSFLKSTFKIVSLVEAKLLDRSIENSMNRFLYANVIAVIEAYLSDSFISTVMSKPALIRKVVETDPEFKKRKFDYSDVFFAYEKVETIVREHLANLIYHNLSKVGRLFKSVLDISFPQDLKNIYRAVEVRHDIVHRNGKSKDGIETEITKLEIHDLIKNSRQFIGYVNSQLPGKE